MQEVDGAIATTREQLTALQPQLAARRDETRDLLDQVWTSGNAAMSRYACRPALELIRRNHC